MKKIFTKLKHNTKKETIKEKKVKEILIVFIVAFISLVGKVMTDSINDLDTMWTFGFCKKIADGYVPYRDYNMVITPLFAQITAIFFKIFSSKMIVYHFVGIIESSILVMFQYMILRKLKISKKISVLCVFLTCVYSIRTCTNSYNILACMFLIILYYIEICKIRYEKYLKLSNKEEKIFKIFKLKISYTFAYNMITGIVLGLIFLSKQNIGVYTILAITIYYFLKNILIKEISFKNSFLQLVVKAVFCLLPIIVECIYLYLNGALYNCIDYCFLGIGTFNEKIRSSLFVAFFKPDNLYQCIINAAIVAFIIIAPAIIALKLKNKIVIKNKLDLNILVFSFLICVIGVAYSIPLANVYHMYVTKLICLFMIFINVLSINGIRRMLYNHISKVAFVICIIVPILCSVLYIGIYRQYIYTSKLEPFKYTYFPPNEELNVLAIAGYAISCEKVNNVPVIITTSNSTVLNIIRNKNGGVFELPLHGNLGSKDYENLINKLKELEQQYDKFAVIIYTSDDDMFWQDAKQLPEYIRDNYAKYDEFMIFSTYIFERKIDE